MTPSRSDHDSRPDAAGLDTPEQVVEQIRRMLANPRRTRR